MLINIAVVHPDYTGQGHQGQIHRYRSVARGAGVEDFEKTRYVTTPLLMLHLDRAAGLSLTAEAAPCNRRARFRLQELLN